MDAMLLVLPGGYTFYTQVVKKANAITNEEADGAGAGKQDEETKKMIEDRRKKRAERRRQKRG